jgi:hypothetical protein
MSQGIISADFTFNLEKRMRVLNEYGYMNMLASENIWYPKVLRDRPLDGKSERVFWLLSTASIEQLTPADGGENGGLLNFEQLATITQEMFPAYFGRGLKISKIKLLNMMKAGVDPAGKWARDIGTYGAYVPQRLCAQALLNGGAAASLAYDGLPFFSTAHLVHPLISALGTFANVFTGSSSGSYPGACPIDDTQTLDTAYINFSKILAYITAAIPQPNGAGDPRFLEPAFVLYPSRMKAQVVQLFDAEFIAKAASSGGGSSDVRGLWKKFKMVEPVEAKELGAGTTYTIPNGLGGTTTVSGNDTTFYVVCKEANNTELGALVQNLRMPFTMHTYSGDQGAEGVDAVLGRSNDMEWHYDGWTAVNYGHPYAIFQCKGS